MKVKCIRNDYGFERFLTVGKTYEVTAIDVVSASFVVVHDIGKGMLPINYFDIVDKTVGGA